MVNLWRKIRQTGRVAEPALPAPPKPVAAVPSRAETEIENTAEAAATRAGAGADAVTEVASGENTAEEGESSAEAAVVPEAVARRAQALGGSLQIRHVDAGSCNGCEIEIASVFGPVYDGERYGARLVASPRHADALLVTGPVTRNMEVALRRTREAVPEPCFVVALGDCARDCGAFKGAYGVTGAVRDVVPVDVEVPGCPPEPEAIISALRGLTGR
jgi:Ni,Fe-hydrogenase III small subunit